MLYGVFGDFLAEPLLRKPRFLYAGKNGPEAVRNELGEEFDSIPAPQGSENAHA